jgi:hypothetical protein
MTDINNVFIEAEKLIHSNKLEEGEELLSSINGEKVAEYWFLRGLLNQKVHHWGEAINCYYKCLDLDPVHHKASAGIEICRNILNFWNPSLYNP